MPPCFCSCWNSDGEAHKNGALAYYPNGNSRRLRDSSSRHNGVGSQHNRGYIPWVWSKKFHETYQLGPVLGTGAFAVVHEATKLVHSDTDDEEPQQSPPYNSNKHKQKQQQSYAIKVLQRHRMTRHDLHHFSNEVQILLDLRHPHVVRLHELYKTPDYFFVVMEKLDGGELFDRLCQKEYYTEMEARNVCKTVFDAVAYIHAQKVAHRDLKPENLLLASSARHNHHHHHHHHHHGDDDDTDDSDDDCWHDVVKVADFGFAKRVPRPNSLHTICGSPSFTAPEIINYQPYDERVDNWSLGVIVYTLLGGYSPFQQDTVRATYQQIRQAHYQFDPEYWDGISRDAKRLISGLLTRDRNRRLTASEALQHPWMIGRGTDLQQNKVNLKQLKKFTVERKEQQQGDVRSVSMYWLLTRR